MRVSMRYLDMAHVAIGTIGFVRVCEMCTMCVVGVPNYCRSAADQSAGCIVYGGLI